LVDKKDILDLEKFVFGLMIFIISPIIAVFSSIPNFRFKEARWIIILFFGLFGMTMIVQDGKDAKVHSDIFVNSYVDKDFTTFKEETKNILLLRSGDNGGATNDDMYLHLISYIGSRLSSNPAILFFIVSFIYGIFYIAGVRSVYENLDNKLDFLLGTIFFLFVFWKSFEGINSIRNWTAGWIFFNGVFNYFKTQHKKYIILVLVSPLVHFAYAAITIPFFVILIFGNRPKIYFLILVVSFFFSLESVDIIYNYLNLTDLGSQKSAYIDQGSSEEYLQEGSGSALHAKYYVLVGKLVVSILFYYAILFLGYLKKEEHTNLMMGLASMGILMISFSNLVSFSITLNNRVFTNGGLYMLAYLVILYSASFRNKVSMKFYGYKMIVYLSFPFILFFTYTQWSNIGDFMNAKVFVSPFLYGVFDGAYSLKELIRDLIF